VSGFGWAGNSAKPSSGSLNLRPALRSRAKTTLADVVRAERLPQPNRDIKYRRPEWWIEFRIGARQCRPVAQLSRRDFVKSSLAATALSPWALRGATPDATWDVVVYSGVPAGIAAAIAASRAGAAVLLIEPTRHVGGMSTSGVNTAETEHMLKWTIGGFALEFYERLGRHYGTGKPEFYFESSVAERVYLDLLREAGVQVHYGAAVDRAERHEARIQSITLTDGTVCRAAVFIDASYEGDLMARAGVSHAVGREARDEYGEEAAGVRFDRIARRVRTVDARGRLLPGIQGWAQDLREGQAHPGVMNYNFRLTVTKDAAARVPIPEPARYSPERFELLGNWIRAEMKDGRELMLPDFIGFLRRRNGKFELNNRQHAVISIGYFGGQFGWPNGTYAEREWIYQDHLDYTLGLIRFLKTDPAVAPKTRQEMAEYGLHCDEFPDNGNLPYQLYVREARRMRGACVVTQRDVTDDRRKSDSIGMSSHFIDSHHVQRLAVSENEFINEGRIWRMGWAYQIPYRALVPKSAECTNLLVPGAASFSHVAFCSYRLESVWMIAGQAAGLAGAMAAVDAVAVQHVPVSRLQERLRAARQVVDFEPGALEKCQDLNGPPEF
jgi:hypothetical protein